MLLAIWMENGCLETHLRRQVGIFRWKAETCTEYATSIKFGIIVDHKCDLPLEHIVIHKPAAYARDVLVTVHQL